MYAIDLYAEVRHAVLRDGISIRAAALRFKLDRKTIRKILQHATPPGYQRQSAPQRPKLGPVLAALDRMIAAEAAVSAHERRSARNIMRELQAQHGYTGSLTVIKDYLRAQRRRLATA